MFTTHAFAGRLAFTFALLCPALARAEPGFATPPGYFEPPRDRYAPPDDDPPPPADDFDVPDSALRISTGPVLRATSERADGGLVAALDIGRRAAGVRFSGSWVGVGSNHGLAQYDAQLWLDFGAGGRLHPIIAAGAGLARLESLTAEGAPRASTIGVGTLRGTLEYLLPVRDADARAGIDIEGALPAIRAQSAPDVGGWLLFTARVGIGF